MTVQDFISSALRLIQVLDSGEQPSSTESDDALATLNQLLASWSSATVPVYQISRDTIALTGAPQYTLASRPLRIRGAACVAGGISKDVTPVTAEEWATLRDKTRSSQFAQSYFYDGGWPDGIIRLWPIPLTGGTLELYTIKPLTAFASLSATVSLPPGYEQALRFALAEALAPEYGSVLSPELAKGAAEAKSAIASLNAAVIGPSLPPAAAQTAAT
jgi:hypothetical protein